MHTPSVGLPRALARVRPPHPRQRSRRGGRSAFRPGRLAGAAVRPVRRTVVARVGLDAAIPAAITLILALASLASWIPGLPARGAVAGAVGGPSDGYPHALVPVERPAPRATARPSERRDVAIPEASAGPQVRQPAGLRPGALDLTAIDPDAVAAARATPEPSAPAGPFLSDGTLVKPLAVTTRVPDGRDRLRIHRIVDGDSLPSIAERYNVSMMTIWWANDLRSHNLVIGKTLTIPPVDGLVVTVAEGDTLYSLAKTHDVEARAVLEANGVDDPVLVPGQTLVLPGAAGEPIPEPTPPPADTPRRAGTPAGAGAGPPADRPVAREPAAYAGGPMVWPVIGGNQSVSRGYAGGHFGLDIAADTGARVVATAGGTVTFAGWKPNGGGYQVWIAHGSGLYTTYNHLSAVSVGNGQSVGAGQLIGRVGSSGNSTGPHLHLEVWHGPIWGGGTRVNPEAHL